MAQFLLRKGGPLTGWLDDRRATGASGFGFPLRAQSVPKRNGTTRLELARRGTNGQFRAYTNRLTSTLSSSDNAEVGGSIPPSPTKDLIKRHFWIR